MIYTIEHEIPPLGDRPGRIRLRCAAGSFTEPQARVIAALLETQDGIVRAEASRRTGSILIFYAQGSREDVLRAASIIDRSYYEEIDPDDGVKKNRSLFSDLLATAARIALCALLPLRIRNAISAARSAPLLMKGLRTLLCRRELNVSVLDASAIGVSMMRGDFRTVSVITNLLSVGDTLEEWTRKRSKASLADGLALNIGKIWVKREGEEVQIPIAELEIGDLAIVRMGSVIPIDGVVEEGEAMVDQSTMTGESEPAHCVPGSEVYAGTAVEDGELIIRVSAFDKETRINKIAEMIDDSEKFKASIQSEAERLADAVVPWSFALAAATWAITGSAIRASAALMVDYSCALKLVVPLAILSAMREGASHGMLIKGGRCLEAMSKADTLVFDKTGTLTVSTPSLVKVVPFGSFSRADVLTIAACLEEHFPHSIARAIVNEAEREGLVHKERHETVEYITAHGLISRLDGKPLRLGSAHFIFEDSGIVPTDHEREIIDREAAHHSMLFLASDGRLIGAFCIDDPIRPRASEAIASLRRSGINKMIMMTGDSERTALSVGEEVGVDEVMSRMLPEDKTEAIRAIAESGRGVIMVGDGINDLPALSSASVGIAMRDAADIARETADMVLTENDLDSLVDVRALSSGVMKKIRRSIACVVGINSLLIVLGITGTITPSVSALLHNMLTVAAGSYSMMPILPKRGRR